MVFRLSCRLSVSLCRSMGLIKQNRRGERIMVVCLRVVGGRRKTVVSVCLLLLLCGYAYIMFSSNVVSVKYPGLTHRIKLAPRKQTAKMTASFGPAQNLPIIMNQDEPNLSRSPTDNSTDQVNNQTTLGKRDNNTASNDTHLVKNLLQILSSPWRQNDSNKDRVRQKLAKFVDVRNMFILTKKNVKVSQVIHGTLGDLPFKIPRDLHQLLPERQLFVDRTYNTCSVVGSGGILLNSSCGHQIDSADAVIRLNLPTLGPFSKDVGNKTTFSTFNKSQFGKYRNLVTPKDRQRFLSDVKGYKDLAILLHSTKFFFPASVRAAKAATGHVYFMHPHPFSDVWKFWKSENHNERLSSGFYLATLALSNCNLLNLYGFWPFDLGPKGHKRSYHYYNDMRVSKAHNFADEFKALTMLHKQGVLKVHVHPCKDDVNL
ncbi:alpha-N-acetylneuraminide alpha-2,8-sialyltransferase-like isoform X1 [Ptychodera flava]|uniref:alpha-N-acetylneuraminide alpha-2,8-sialyltransferase-like isoform X1 n=2 Tax=Ptychodera flava TaxID=63121 RepID=UPI00396A50B2